MPDFGIRNKDAATKSLDINGFDVAEVSESGIQMVKPLKVLVPAAGDEPVRMDQAFGVGQTWQDMTGVRAPSVAYFNLTNKPIAVSIYWNSASVARGKIEVNGARADNGTNAIAGGPGTCRAIIPPGAGYAFYDGTIIQWLELRA